MQEGIFPAIQDALDHGFRPSLSVDIDAPNDMFTQMRTVFGFQRALSRRYVAQGSDARSPMLKVEDVLEFATLAGAKANGLDHKVGTLAVGKQADVILLRTDRINVLPLKNPVGATVLGMDTGNVDSVFVAGRALKRSGALVGVDIRSISERALASQVYLLSANGPA
jgi:cytosine/adenosine deaminase-related metal-dependent hydrolase